MSFLDVKVSRTGNKFVTTVYRKPTFSGGYTHCDRFLPITYKFGRTYTLAFRCFSLCSYSTKFHNELAIFQKNIRLWYNPDSFQNHRKLTNVFHFKDRLSCNFVTFDVYKFQYGRCNTFYYPYSFPVIWCTLNVQGWGVKPTPPGLFLIE